MRSSSGFVAPSAIAILSTALLSSLSGTAMSQTATGSGTPLPNVTVEAPRQVARPQRPEVTPQGSGRVAHRASRTSRSAQTANGTPSAARGPVMAKLARLEREASSCNDGCESSFRHGKDPWVGCSESGVLLSFLSNVQRHTHPQGLRAMRGNQNVPGLGPTTILVVLHRHAGWGEISGHRTESKQVAHSSRGSIADSSTSCAICVRTARSKCSHCITISIQGSIPPTRAQPKSVSGQSRHFGRRPTTSGLPL